MIWMLLALCALIGISPAPVRSQAAVSESERLRAGIDSFVSRRVADDAFSGTVLVARGGEIIFRSGFGKANEETGIAMTPDTRLTIASMTKLLTQVAIRQLEQAQRLSLSDTVGKFLPQYPNPVVRSKVTIDQLLRHRSGIGNFWNERYAARRTEVRSVSDYLELFQDDSLLFEPGTRQQYSNGGYVVLGAIIERVSGQPYHDYLRDHVFRPAGMTQTTPYDLRDSLPNAAVGYTRMTDGGRRTPGPRRPNTDSKPGLSGPAGDHYSSVDDLHRLATALTNHQLLDSTHTAALLGPRYAEGAGFRAAGGGPGVNAELSLYPSGFVVVVLSNYDPPSATEVAQYIRSLITSAPLANARDRR